MKTNKKRVISILLTVAVIVSMVSMLGSVAMAAPALSDGAASLDGDDVTVTFSGVDTAGAAASLMATLKVGGGYVFVDQYVLVEGDNSITFPIDALALKGLVINIRIAAGAGDGIIIIGLAINVDKTALGELLGSIPYAPDKDKYIDETWAYYAPFVNAAQIVWYDPLSSQAEVDEAYDNLLAAFEALVFKATKVVLVDVPPTLSVKRGEKITLVAEGFSMYGSPVDVNIEWTISNPAYATITKIDGYSALITVLNKTGTVNITAKDVITGFTTTFILRIL